MYLKLLQNFPLYFKKQNKKCCVKKSYEYIFSQYCHLSYIKYNHILMLFSFLSEIYMFLYKNLVYLKKKKLH